MFLAPIGVIGICTQDGHGDLATARAAAATGVPMVASTLEPGPAGGRGRASSARPRASSSSTRPTDREVAASLVYRAEAAGFKGIVVTLDTWLTGWRPRDLNTVQLPATARTCV